MSLDRDDMLAHTVVTLLVRGASSAAELMRILAVDGRAVSAVLSRGTEQALLSSSGGKDALIRLTPAGKQTAERHCSTDPSARPPIAELYAKDFLPLNQRVKRACAQWQLGGATTRPARILRALSQTNCEAQVLLSELEHHYARSRLYATRLASAIDGAASGDPSFVASPFVDSFHSVWFELHEELLRVLGRHRAAEAEDA